MAALPAELVRLGHKVSVLSPWYADLSAHRMKSGAAAGPARRTRAQGVRLLFLETPDFKRPGIYHADDVQRFSAWGRLALTVLSAVGVRFDVLHGHDWAAGLVVAHSKHAPLAERVYHSQPAIPGPLEHRPERRLDRLAASGFDSPRGLEFYGDVNLMKAGLIYAGHVTTVSPTYALEITTPEFGEGLQGVLQTGGAGHALRGDQRPGSGALGSAHRRSRHSLRRHGRQSGQRGGAARRIWPRRRADFQLRVAAGGAKGPRYFAGSIAGNRRSLERGAAGQRRRATRSGL